MSYQGAKNNAKAQQQSLLQDAVASDRAAVATDNSAKVADNNSQLASYQAIAATRQGKADVANEYRIGADTLDASRADAANTKSAQKVSMAANGIDVTQGTANDVLTSTDYLRDINDLNIQDATRRNVAAIRNDAVRSAWGYRTQGTSYKDSAATARADAELYRYDAGQQRNGARGISPSRAANLSLIGSATRVAGAWYSMSKAGA